MRSFTTTIGLLGTLIPFAFAAAAPQSTTPASPSAKQTTSATNAISIATSDILAAVSYAVGTGTTPNQSQLSALETALSAYGAAVASSITQRPLGFLTQSGATITSLPASYESVLQSEVAAAVGSDTALPALKSIVSGKPFSNFVVSQITELYGVEAAASTGLASVVRSELGVTGSVSATGGSTSTSKGGAAETGVGKVAAVGMGVVAGVVGVALL